MTVPCRILIYALFSVGLFAITVNGQGRARWQPGEILVGVSGNDVDLEETWTTLDLRVIERDAISGAYRLATAPGAEEASIEQVGKIPGVVFAERNGLGEVAGQVTLNDTFAPQLWHVENTGQIPGFAGVDLRLKDAWAITRGSSTIGIAILDSGIDVDHPEFTGRLDPDGQDFVNGDNDPDGIHPHGTWVAGCLAANADNAFAVAGVDHHCRVLPLQVIGAGGTGTSFDLAQALNYAAMQSDVHVINMSLQNYPIQTVLTNAMLTASQSGKILVACASNLGPGAADTSYPGSSPHVITVGNTTAFDQINTNSGTGNALDFVAPGTDIDTAKHGTSVDTFETVTGCSFATPITCGVIGLILAHFEQHNLPLPDQAAVFGYLQAGALDQVGPAIDDLPGYDTKYGHGRIDAAATLAALPLLGDCAAGNIDLAFGPPAEILTINGQSRTGAQRRVIVGLQQSLTFAVDLPLSNPNGMGTPANFVIWGAIGEPGTFAPFDLPFGLGPFCFPPQDLSPLPNLFVLANSFYNGLPPVLPSFPAPWSLTTAGLPFPAVVTLQGVIIDTPSSGVGITNAVVLDVRLLDAPVIQSIDAPTGTPGTLLDILGEDFQPGTQATLNGAPLPLLAVTSNTLTFAEPAGLLCDATIVVTNPDGQFTGATFAPSPTISSASFPSGTPAAGGELMFVIGAHFGAGATISVGGVAATMVSQTDNVLVGLSPPGTPGPTNLVVTTSYGCTVSHPYTYGP